MPVKPTVTYNEWATDTNFTNGSAAGNPTKVSIPAGIVAEGHIPDDSGPGQSNAFPMSAEHFNDYLAIMSKYGIWVKGGSSAALEEPSVVERDATGIVNVAELVAGPATTARTGATITGGVGNATGLRAHGDGTGTAIQAESHGLVAAIIALGDGGTSADGDGAGIDATGAASRQGGIFRGGAGAAGLQGLGEGAGAGATLFGGTTGAGVVSTGGANAGSGGAFIGGATGGKGLTATGGGAGAGATITAGATGKGLEVNGGATAGVGLDVTVFGTTSDGLQVSTAAGADSATQGIDVTALGDAEGLRANAVDGYCLHLNTTGVKRAPLHMDGQATDPTTQLDGDVWLNNAAADKLKAYLSGATKYIQTAKQTLVSAFEQASGNTGGSMTEVNVGSAFSFVDIPDVVMDVVLVVTVGFTVTAVGDIGTSDLHTFKITDTTAAADVFSHALSIPHVGSSIQNYFKIEVPYTLPAAGARTFQMKFTTSGSATNGTVAWTRATCRIIAKPA
jgi:hypothetical protein